MNLKEQIRFLHADEMADAVALADSVFRSDGRVSMGESLPKVFSQSLLQAIGCFSDGELVSFAGFVPSIVQVGKSRISIYSYGAVCTHAAYRGRGHARSILQFAKQQAELAGASLLLVSGELPLYTEVECYPFGTTERFKLLQEQLTNMTPSCSHGIVCREATNSDWFHLHKLAATRSTHYEISLWDMADLMRAQALAAIRRMRHRTFLAEKNGVPVAFCIVALKPNGEEDGSNGGLVIEWAGEAEAVVSLLLHVLENEQVQYIEAVIPSQEKSLAQLLKPAFLGLGRNQGTVHIVNAERLFEQLAPYWTEQEASDILPVVRTVDSKTFELSIGGHPWHELNGQELVSLLFDCEAGDSGRKDDWKKVASAYFPLPFPYTKGLNFV